MSIKTSSEIRSQRMDSWDDKTCSDLGIAAPWPKKKNNLGSLLRTADALNACLWVPSSAPSTYMLRKGDGNTLGIKAMRLVHWFDEFDYGAWDRVVCVELAHGSIPLVDLRPSEPGEETVVVLGHEVTGVPDDVLALANDVVEIPMVGLGNSLNVAVAGSLVAYKVRGWA